MASGDLYTLAFNINCAGEETTCVLGYHQESGLNGPNTLELACQEFIDDKIALLLPVLSDECTVTRVKMDTVTDHNEVPGLIDMNGFPGAVPIPTIPASMTALIHLPCTAPNAKHNGRIYISGVPRSSQVLGVIIPAEVVKFQTFATELLDDLVPGGGETAVFNPVVISRFLAKVKRTPPVGFPLLLPVAKADMRQQRRRKTPHFGLA